MIHVTNLDETLMLFRPIVLCGALVVSTGLTPVHAVTRPVSVRVGAGDASFFRTVLRHTAGVEARFQAEAAPVTPARAAGGDPTEGTVGRDSSKTAAYIGGVALAGLAAYFIASSGHDAAMLAPNLDPGGNVDLPAGDPFTPMQPNLPPDESNRGGNPGQPGGDEPEQGLVPDPTTVTPEPVSMTLMATGLAGMGVANLRRRRRAA